MKKTIGIIFADEMEYVPFLNLSEKFGYNKDNQFKNNCISFELSEGENQVEVIAVECGIGKVNAGFAAAFLAFEKKVDYILNAGLSGAISGLKREDILACTSFVECDFDLTAIGYELGNKADKKPYIYESDKTLLDYVMQVEGVKSGKVGTGDIFLTDTQKKKLFHDTFGICAFDMETAAIASVCYKCDVPFISIRKISDDADDCGVDDYREMNERCETQLSEILFSVIEKIAKNM